MFKTNFVLFLTIFFLLSTSTLSTAQDWPALRGADGYGTANTNGILSRTSDVELKPRWKKKLGSGYSSVVVADQKLVTMYSAEKEDKLICLNASDGATNWEFIIGPRFR